MKIYEAEGSGNGIDVGEFQSDGETIRVGTTDGAIEIKDLQLEGKKRMKTADFLRGYEW